MAIDNGKNKPILVCLLPSMTKTHFSQWRWLGWLKDKSTQAANDDTDDKPTKGIQVFHYHKGHLGTPNELTNQNGEVIWLVDHEAW